MSPRTVANRVYYKPVLRTKATINHGQAPVRRQRIHPGRPPNQRGDHPTERRHTAPTNGFTPATKAKAPLRSTKGPERTVRPDKSSKMRQDAKGENSLARASPIRRKPGSPFKDFW